jgi:hypothetical protein
MIDHYDETNKEYQGGYMAQLHTLAEASYGPNGPLEPRSRVFEFLKHAIVRNNGDRKPMGTADIMKATGISRRQVERAISFLVKGEFIIAHHRKTRNQLEKNSYELHPRIFGNDYIYNGVKKPLRFIKGGKADEKSDPPEDPNVKEGYRQTERYPTDNLDGRVPSDLVNSPHESSDKPSSQTPFIKPSWGESKEFHSFTEGIGDLGPIHIPDSHEQRKIQAEQLRALQELERKHGT